MVGVELGGRGWGKVKGEFGGRVEKEGCGGEMGI